MPYKTLDMSAYRRKAHFDYFRAMASPYVGLTANVDITALLAKVKAEKLPFFLTICYCAAQAANSVPEFRQRIVGEGIAQFDHCPTSHTVALEDGTYCYCTLRADMPFTDYILYAQREQEEAKQRGGIDEDAEEALDKFFISTLPWLSYTSLIQPTPFPADSKPAHHLGKVLPAGRPNAPAPLRTLPPRADRRPAHRPLLSGVGKGDGGRSSGIKAALGPPSRQNSRMPQSDGAGPVCTGPCATMLTIPTSPRFSHAHILLFSPKGYSHATKRNIFCLPQLVDSSEGERYNRAGGREKYENAEE